MALLMTGQPAFQSGLGTPSRRVAEAPLNRYSTAGSLQPVQQVTAVIDRARALAAPQAKLLGQPRHVGHAMTFRLDALSRGATLQDVQRMGQYAKDRLNASYVRLTQRLDGSTVMELPVAQSRDIFLDGNRAVLSGAKVMLGPLFTEQGSAVLDLDQPASHHVLMVASLTEKTMLLRALWYQLVRQNRPSALRFIVIDPATTLPASIHHSAHLLCAPIQASANNDVGSNVVVAGEDGIASRTNTSHPDLLQFEIRQALQTVASEIHRRQTSLNPDPAQPRLVVIITELADLLKRKSLQGLLRYVIEQGRGVKVHVVAGTTDVSAQTLQHSLVQQHFKARLVGQMPNSAQSELACDGPGFFCEWALGNGDITYTLTHHRFQCGIVSDGELRFLPRAIGLPDIWQLSSGAGAAFNPARTV